MKQGKHFRIPESAADMHRLWNESQPIRPADLPRWLGDESAASYRLVGSARSPAQSSDSCSACLKELEELESCGLVVDRDPTDLSLYHVYISAPSQEAVWSIGIYAGSSPLHWRDPDDVCNPVLTSNDITDVPAVFVADPFMVHAVDAWYMFFEVMNWRSGKGEIGLAVSKDTTRWHYQRIVLAEPFHLSYPYVFRWSGDYYMIPETHQAGTIRLYKADQFPTVWSFAGTLLEGPYLVDASVLHHDGRWWLFTETSPERAHDTLRLFWSDELRGPWHEHPCSPVARGDARIARPAGRLLPHQGKLMRFAQNCAAAYGSEVCAVEVTELTPTTYRERVVDTGPVLAPSGSGWNACGMHHIDAHRCNGRWVACVDGWNTATGNNQPGTQNA